MTIMRFSQYVYVKLYLVGFIIRIHHDARSPEHTQKIVYDYIIL